MADSTYTKSDDCARAAGVRNLELDTFPSINDIDVYRLEAWSDIVNIIGDLPLSGMTKIQKQTVYKIEKHIVVMKIWKMFPEDRRYRRGEDRVTRQQKQELQNVFQVDVDPFTFEPGENT
jgi:hypothetical protein